MGRQENLKQYPSLHRQSDGMTDTPTIGVVATKSKMQGIGAQVRMLIKERFARFSCDRKFRIAQKTTS